MEKIFEKISAEIFAERERQNSKWGEQNHPSVDPDIAEAGKHALCGALGIPTEDGAKFLCVTADDNKCLTWAHIAVEELSEAVCATNDEERRKELVQLAAVVAAWIENIDRNKVAVVATEDDGN